MKSNLNLAAALAISAFVAGAGVSLPASAAGTPDDNASCAGGPLACSNFLNACHLGGGTLVETEWSDGPLHLPTGWDCVFQDANGQLILDINKGKGSKPGRATFQTRPAR